MCFDYRNIDELLTRLLRSVTGIFADGEVKEVQEFVDAGEYGIALETFASIVDEEKKSIPEGALTIVRELAHVMQMDASTFDAKLLGRVDSG